MKAVLDTNVLVSAALFGGPPAQIFPLWTSGKLRLMATPAVLTEYFSVFLYPKFKPDQERTTRFMNEVVLPYIHMVRPTPSKLAHPSRDANDDAFLSAAIVCKAEYLITGDKDLLVLNRKYDFKILTPAEFLKQI